MGRRVRTMMVALAAGALLLGATGCAATKAAPVPSAVGVEPAVTVRVVDNRYEPSQVNIARGQAVRWVFEGQAKHDVVATDASFVSELMTEGEYTHVFESAGDFLYDCSIHPEMTGRVSVSQ